MLAAASVIVAVAYSGFVPESSKVSYGDFVKETDRRESSDELDAAENKMEEKLRNYKKSTKNISVVQKIISRNNSSLWITWIPWFVIPFLLRVKNITSVAVLLSVPLLLMNTELIEIVEVTVFGLVLFMSYFL